MGINYDCIYSEGMATMPGKNLVRQGERRREQIMRFIVRYVDQHGYSPTLSEIGKGVGIASPNAVRGHLDKLEAEGRIAITPRIARSIVLQEQQT